MPTYGPAKFRDMSRSILPSSRRRSARAKRRMLHHSARQQVRQALHNIRSCEDWDDADDPGLFADPQYGPCKGGWFVSNIHDMVLERREADKVAPAERWAEGRVRKDGIPRQDRVSWLDAQFPHTLAGQHAVYGHIARSPAFEQDHDHVAWYHRYRDRLYETAEERAQDYAARHADRGPATRRARLLHDALSARLDRLGALNRAIKAAWTDLETPPRCLLGAHDLDAFVRWIVGRKEHWRRLGTTGGANGAGWRSCPDHVVDAVVAFCELTEEW